MSHWRRPAAPAQTAVGYFEGSGDVGAPALAGSTTYDATAQAYTIVGGGTNMWATRDEFQFVWRKMTGDFIVRTHAALLQEPVSTRTARSAGLCARASTQTRAYVDAAIHGDGLTFAAVPQDVWRRGPSRSSRCSRRPT